MGGYGQSHRPWRPRAPRRDAPCGFNHITMALYMEIDEWLTGVVVHMEAEERAWNEKQKEIFAYLYDKKDDQKVDDQKVDDQTVKKKRRNRGRRRNRNRGNNKGQDGAQ